MNWSDGMARDLVDVQGVMLECRTVPGSGVPILMLHEGLGSVGMWKRFPDQLAEATHRPVLAWSRRGHGWSAPLAGRRDVDYMHREAALVAPLMDRLGIAKATLFGHSDGGSIALIAASTNPGRVDRLVLQAPHVYVETLTVDSIRKAKDIFTQTDMKEKLGRYHRDPADMFWAWNDIWLDPRFLEWNIEEYLPDIAAPALLVQGWDDEYGTVDQLARIEARLKETQRVMISDCGHSPHRDHPDQVLRAVRGFLAPTAA